MQYDHPTVFWDAATLDDVGTYEIFYEAVNGFDQSYTPASFILTIKSYCSDADLIIDPLFVPSTLTYEFESPEEIVYFDTSLISSTVMECNQPLDFTISYQNGADLDANLMRFDSENLFLSIYSEDYDGYADNLQHDLVMTVKHEFELNVIEIPFTVMLSLTCSPYDIKYSPENDIVVDYVTTEPDKDIGAYTFEQVFSCPVSWPNYPYQETVIDLPSFVSRD